MSASPVRQVHVTTSAIDVNLLARLLADAAPALTVIAASGQLRDDPETLVVSGGAAHGSVHVAGLAVPGHTTCGREYWIAAAVARRLRRVEAPQACTSKGLERLIADGHYSNPIATVPDASATVGLLMFKPGVRVTTMLLEDLQQRVAECGYIVAEARAIHPAIVRERRLIRRHYSIHQEIAERGVLTVRERVRLLDLYDRPEFAERFGEAAGGVPVAPVERFLAESDVPVDVLNRWSEDTAERYGLNGGGLLGANEVGDDKYVNLFVDPRAGRVGSIAPVFLLNPHMPSVISWYEEAVHPVFVFILQSHAADALVWSRMRHEFCGATDPACACPGSLRRDGMLGLLPIDSDHSVRLTRANNGVHLSSGPVETLREVAIWFDRQPEDLPLGRALLEAGVGLSDVMARSYMEIDGRSMLVTEATRGRTTPDVVEMLACGRLLGIESQGATAATLARLDVAWRYARTIAARPDVTAVIATGSVARNRASTDSDVDLVIVTESPSDVVSIERAVVDGLVVECEWMTLAKAIAVACADDGDLKSLRESSRIGFGVPVYDPRGVHAQIEAASRGARPGQAAMLIRLREVVAAVDALQDDNGCPGQGGWRVARGVLDNVAVVLLAFHQLRYQKPKWVIRDLEDTGHAGLAESLLHAYGVSSDGQRAAEVADLVVQLVSEVATRLQLPSYELMLRHGFLDEHPDFSLVCRSLADAKSLLADGSLAAAEYAAKFSAGMALALCEGQVHEEVERLPCHRALFAGQDGVPVDGATIDACVTWTTRALALYSEAYTDVVEPA